MASYTSVTSGNWNANTTWGTAAGVYPSADGDTATVAAGHTVTYNVTTALSTGFSTITVNSTGKLTYATGSRMRVNADINVYGTYEIATSNVQVYFRGTNRSLYFPGTTCALNLVGSNATPMTTLSSAVNAKQSILPVAANTNFAIGDWISVYKSHETKLASFDYNRGYNGATTDEGFIINAISANNIYIREFVGPNTTISSISANVVTVANSNIFRTYQQLIVANSTTYGNVVSINYTTNQITLDTQWSTSLAGNTIYTAGTLKNHASGELVRKNAWLSTGSYASGCTSITLVSAGGLSINDTIHITSIGNTSVGGPSRGSTCEYTISNIVGNVLTITPGTLYGSSGNEYVLKTSRDTIIAADGANTSSYRVWADYNDAVTRFFRVKDVRFQNIGNFYSQGGFSWNGATQRYGSANVSDWVGSEFENSVIQMQAVDGWIDPWNYDLNGMFSDNMYGNCVRNNIFLNCQSVAAGWYDWDRFVYNNYSWNGAYGLRCEGLHSVDQGGSEISYNLIHRGNDGNRCNFYDQSRGFHHNRITHCYRPGHQSFSLSNFCWQNEWNYCNGWSGFGDTTCGHDTHKFIYNVFYNMSVGTDNWRLGNDNGINDPTRGAARPYVLLEHNYDINAVAQFFSYGHRIWDSSQNAWRTYRMNTTNNNAGAASIIYVPVNANITVTAAIMRPIAGVNGAQTTSAGNIPYFRLNSAYQTQLNTTTNAMFAAGLPMYADQSQVQFTSASLGTYEYKTLTLPARPFGRYVVASVFSDDANAYMGWWEKEMEIQIDTPPMLGARAADYVGSGVKNTTNKLILGG